MATYKETIKQGTDTTTTWKYTDAAGRLDYTVKDSDYATDGVVDQRETVDYTHDAAGRLTSETYSQDLYADGAVEWQNFKTLDYTADGRLNTVHNASPDVNGEGNPDYSDTTYHSYDAAGRLVVREQVWNFDGVPNGIDYRMESMTYNAKGLLDTHFVDDTSLQDFPIGFRHTYDSAGRLIKTQMQNEFEFGDQNWRTEDTYKYSGGRLVETNQYGEWFQGTHVLEIKNKMSYDSSGNLTKEVITGQSSSWVTVEKMQVEHWYWGGKETTRLTSFDENLDGVFDAGSRTLEKWSYHTDGQLASHTVDMNAGDSIVEYSFISELLVA